MSRTRHDVLTEFRTAEILRAATALFADRGFAATTVEDIAHAADVAKGTVYLYFPSKEDIYRAAFLRNVDELKERSLAALGQPGDVAAKLLAFVRTKLAYFDEHHPFFAVYFAEMAGGAGSGGLQDALESSWQAQIDALTALLEDGIRAAEVRPLKAQAVASAIFDLTRSTVIRRARRQASPPADEDARVVFDLLWKGLSA
jgi:AcrR family transcriptional regulator